MSLLKRKINSIEDSNDHDEMPQNKRIHLDLQSINESSNCEQISTAQNTQLPSLVNMPEEVIIAIFNHLQSEDLLTSTLVCKRFNNIISDSQELMKKFSLQFKNSKDLWNGRRKYRNVKIHKEAKLQKCMSYFLIWGKSLTNLKIDSYTESLEELNTALHFCDNLKNLDIRLDNTENKEINFWYSASKLNLDRLNLIFADEKCLKLFHKCSIKTLKIQDRIYNSTVPEITKAYEDFFQTQSQLEELDFHINYLFDDDRMKNVKFQLKNLAVRGCCVIDEGWNLANFLKLHKNSMENLMIEQLSDSIIDVLNEMPKLKSLSAKGIFNSKFNSKSLKSLELNYVSNLEASQIPLVTNLILSFSDISSINELKYLEKLTICYKHPSELFIPTVKVLEVDSLISKTFRFLAPNLEELILRDCKMPQLWLIDYLQKDDTALNTLEIVNSILTKEMLVAIFDNGNKIKKWTIVNSFVQINAEIAAAFSLEPKNLRIFERF